MKRFLVALAAASLAAASPSQAASPKLESALARLAVSRTEGPAKARAFAEESLLPLEGDSALVTIRPTWGARTDAIDFHALAATGTRVLARSRSFIRALVPIGALGAAAECPGVAFIERPIAGHPLIVSQGVSLTGADVLQSLGYDGSGTRVAVLDNGFIGWMNAVNQGELPASVASRTFDFSGTGFATETEHGTAVAEAVHDMAPGAELTLMKIGDAASLEIALDTCIARGIDVVNHSVGWFGQPGDGSGAISAVADTAASRGILWVNAAGNHAWGHNEGIFTDTDADGWHEFAPGSEEILISIANPAETVRIHLTWNAWPTTNEDYDLYLTNQMGMTLASSTNSQALHAQEPREFIGFTGASGTLKIKIKKVSTTTQHSFDLFVMDQDLQTHRVTAGSLLAPADARGAVAVGAINRNSWAAGPQEYFSSQGPTNDGRVKPDLCGPDNCNSYTYGAWHGTSLASPHVAGAAALLFSAYPTWNADSVRAELLAGAIDLGPAGPDSVYGHGKLALSPPPPSPPAPFTATAWNGEVVLSWTNPSNVNFQSTTIRFSTAGYPLSPAGGSPLGVFAGPPGSDSSFTHAPLANGTTYWYSAFAYDGSSYSIAAEAHATPSGPDAPGAPSLAAIKGDGEVLLEWTAPSDPDLEGIRIEYGTAPLSGTVGAGLPLPSGLFRSAAPSATGRDTLSGATNGTTYYFNAFAYDSTGHYSVAAEASATPADTIPPVPPLAFAAEGGDNLVLLRWTNSPAPDVAGIEIRFSTLSPPATPQDGDTMMTGWAGRLPGAPSQPDSFMHVGLLSGLTYYYSAFAFDDAFLYSSRLVDSATTNPASAVDTIPPGMPIAFTAYPGDREIRLEWTNPVAADFAALRIRYSTSAHPATPAEGNPIENGAGGVFPGEPASDSFFIHQGLTNGTMYFYSAFAFDDSGNHSPAAVLQATPADTTAPGPILAFSATPGEGSILLAWTNPSDADFAHAVIRFDTTAYPATPAAGLPVPEIGTGVFPGAPGAHRSFTHAKRIGGVTYYYSAFAFDADSNRAAAATASASPLDTTPPGPLALFSATAGIDNILVRWTNPNDPDFAGTTIRFSPIAFPNSPSAGFPLPNGADGFFPAGPGEQDSFVHIGLANGITYRYAAFPSDRKGNFGPRAQAAATLVDTIAPPPPPTFAAGYADGAIVLRWTHASGSDFAGTYIVFSTDQVPLDRRDGTPVPSTHGGYFPGAEATADSFTHEGLVEGTAYYYAAYSYDAVPNFSTPAVDSAATPADTIAPELVLGILPNPYLLYYLDLYLLASEPLDPESVFVEADGALIPMTRTDPIEEVWLGKARLAGAGSASILAAATDRAGNRAEVSGSVSYAPAPADRPLALASPDGAVVLRVDAGAAGGARAFSIVPTAWNAGLSEVGPAKTARPAVLADEGAYAIQSIGAWPRAGASLECLLDPSEWAGVPLEEIALEHATLGTIPLVVDKERFTAGGPLASPGIVRLTRDRSGPSRPPAPSLLILEPNAPNPFNPETTIRFTVGAKGPARVTIHTVSGRLVRTLFDGEALPGAREVLWDGRDDAGLPAGSGAYLYRVETDRASDARLMILLR
ncbi:MAG: S8 family serine peptidase [Candidatus Eisenbacteria bacterium]|nr:S8 family serine peptidase [Candidatus Eisenbacteria bacterium]